MRRHGGTWHPQLSNLRKWVGYSSKTRKISPHCCQSKWFMSPLQVWDDPGHLGKGHGNWDIPFGKLALKTCGMCYAWLAGNQFQSISGSIPCMRCQWAVIDTVVSYTLKYRHGIRCLSCYLYVSPLTVYLWTIASSGIPDQIAPGWHFMELDLATFATSPYRRKRPVIMLRVPRSQWGSHYPTMPSLAQNSPKHRPTAGLSSSWATSLSSAANKSQFSTTLSKIRLKGVGEMRPPWVVPIVTWKLGTWYPFPGN